LHCWLTRSTDFAAILRPVHQACSSHIDCPPRHDSNELLEADYTLYESALVELGLVLLLLSIIVNSSARLLLWQMSRQRDGGGLLESIVGSTPSTATAETKADMPATALTPPAVPPLAASDVPSAQTVALTENPTARVVSRLRTSKARIQGQLSGRDARILSAMHNCTFRDCDRRTGIIGRSVGCSGLLLVNVVPANNVVTANCMRTDQHSFSTSDPSKSC